MNELCSNEEMQSLISVMQSGSGDEIRRFGELLEKYPNDARLHFMKGSALIGHGKLIEAHDALRRAIEIAPDFAIARFQFGFFLLTSGEAQEALNAWQRLDQLEDGHYLKIFVQGLRHLIADDFERTVEILRAGIKANDENPPLNNDMQLIIDQCLPHISKEEETEEQATSATSLILGQYDSNSTKH